MRTLNLGILAHVDAGKTTLTERLLFAAGIIDEVGSVDEGSTQTDFLALEQQRGITIKTAVVSFPLDGVTVNLVDTPGHPDFIAEVERALAVLDGVVLVVSAVEGVQAQTPLLMRALQRLRIPTLLFVNKIDRGGARYDEVLGEIRERLTRAIVPMGSVHDLGSRSAGVRAFGGDELDGDVLAEYDDAILAAYVDGDGPLPQRRLRRALAAQTRAARVHPVFFGSALTGAGVETLMGALTRLLPAVEGDPDAPVSGSVFKIDRGAAGEKICFARIFSGAVRMRDRISLHGKEQRVTAISVFEDGSDAPHASVAAGRIGKLWGLEQARIGDVIGAPPPGAERHRFAPPTLETAVVAVHPEQKLALHTALAQLAEQDPLINLRQDDLRGELYVSLYGEVQKEVLQQTLADDFGIEAEFRETTTICVERPVGFGEAVEVLREEPNPFLATVGLRVEPAPGDGVEYGRAREVLGKMPAAFFKAVEETVRRTLQQGLYGWQVTGCKVTMTRAGYLPRQSHAHQRFDKSMSSTGADFRNLTPLVLMDALRQAGTVVHQPVHRFRLEARADELGTILAALPRLGAVPESSETRDSTCVVEGRLPAARMQALQLQVRALTRGEGVLELSFDRYEPVRGEIPTRPRTDLDPLNRKEYLLRLTRRV